MRSTMSWIVAAAALLGVSSACAAPLMLQPQSASSPFEIGGSGINGPVSQMVDQSGLFTPYVSGVTDYAAYIASNPFHSGYNASGTLAAGNPFWVDFDLGASYLVDRLAFWNYHLAQGGVTGLAVYTADNAGFANALLVGTLSPATYTSQSPPYGYVPVQDFDLTDSTARYVRLYITSYQIVCGLCWTTPYAGIGEVAFGGQDAVVPVPAALWMFGGALGALSWIRRKGAS
jgi:hypothetical protein